MNSQELILLGNQMRGENKFEAALEKYALAMATGHHDFVVYNNFGNVLREVGAVRQSIPFLQTACNLMPSDATAHFNLAVAYLSLGDYDQGWPLYEHRWNYEHLQGQLPKLNSPQWQGESLQGKTILVLGEQGHGDIIQFSRFLFALREQGAKIKFSANENVYALFAGSVLFDGIYREGQDVGDYDYWCMIMSLPLHLKINLQNLFAPIQYIGARPEQIQIWQNRLGVKQKLRAGIAYSGRKDSWINQHKSMPIESVLNLIDRAPQVEWISLQADASSEDVDLLQLHNVKMFPSTIRNWADTAGLLHHLDLIISVDTAVAHLAGAMGRPTWVPLSRYATCWRWGLEQETMPWYPSVKLFRQSVHGDWSHPRDRMVRFLETFKI